MSMNHKILKQQLSASSVEDLTNGGESSSSRGSTLTGLSGRDTLESGRWTLPRLKTYDAVVFDMLRVMPDDLATQITFMDLPIFKAITPEELTSCAWSGKDKNNLCPNIVAFTRRFNHVSFWVVHEILTAQSLKIRAEIVGQFVKIAKKLYELNNYHSLMAVISALHSAPIFRLSKTWNLLHKKERSTCEKLADLMTEDDNRQRLREHMDIVRLPCIPYLGLYLQDLIFIDAAHPSTGGIDSERRSRKMNNVLRTIAEFQLSTYDIEHLPYVQSYLKSVRYIDELQKFVEEDNYKLSLQIEPINQQSNVSKSREELDTSVDRGSSPGKSTPATPQAAARFTPGHRKTKSLGTTFVSHTAIEPLCLSNCHFGNGPRHLLDDSLLEETSSRGHPSITSSIEGSMNGMTIGSNDGSEHSDDQEPWIGDNLTESCEDLVQSIPEVPISAFKIHGYLKRKPDMKSGRKVSVSAWTRYWVGLWGTNIVHYAAKYFTGHDRSDFKIRPCKLFSIIDWVVLLPETRGHNIILLTDLAKGNSYKYKAPSYAMACQWVRYLDEATKKHKGPKTPANLMSFD
ncbi:ras-specific guanine nucleotide-releasing factor RalGPS1-like [Asterias rubens]|uniref:ras-specific guanine nucleotide-releasing factor RalGPS1-like n=1 Tax=Asterias rubens TaxID=7604 RepID=UPI001454F465|nr:ras-specific guanine nucleotide-releasing factor RalGPS1-like [Asterias rubens]